MQPVKQALISTQESLNSTDFKSVNNPKINNKVSKTH